LVTRDRALAARPRLNRARLGAGLALLVLVLAGVILVETLPFLFLDGPGSFAFSLVFVLLVSNLGIVGGILAVRRPDNVIGWLLLGSGLPEAIGIGGAIYARLDSLLGGGHLPLVLPAAWLGAWTVPPTIGILVIFLPIVFPSGRLPGPRWRFVVIALLVAMGVGAVAAATAPGPLAGIDRLANPLVLPPPIAEWVQALGALSSAVAVAGFALGASSLVLRFRRSRGIERQQLKWFLFVAVITAACLAFSMVLVTGPLSDAMWILGLLSMAFLPVAIGVAVLRHRLYEIDRIVSRAVGYSLVTATVVGLFLLIVVASEALLSSFTDANNVAVAASTLIVASLFQPIRRAIQARVDRRFDRARVDTDRIAVGFADRLRDQLALEAIDHETRDAIEQALHPAFATIWLRSRTDPS
jgi:hypothetical protein